MPNRITGIEDSVIDENVDNVTERNPAINITELPGKSYGITVEVPLFLALLCVSLSGAAVSNIILYRTCVHSLGHSVEECHIFLSPDKSNVTKQLEQEVQKYATFINTVRMILESVMPAFLSFFLGVWSDTHGRKPLVVWPILGAALSAIMIAGYSMMDNLGPWWFVLTSIPYSLTGGFTVLFTGAYCYMSDITTAQSRSLRMTILEASVSVGSVIGSVASSYLLRAVGNVYLLLITATFNVIAYVYSNVYLKESLTGAVQGGITTVLDLLLVKEMFRECFKQRPNHGRIQILLATFTNALSIFILYGLIQLEYMYTREKLHWSLREYTIFSALNTMISFVGSFIGVGLIQKVLPISDIIFAIIAFLSSIAEYIIKCFAVTSWYMYLGAGISMFKGLSAPLIRSFLSKILPVEDIAKVFSLMCALEGLCPLFSPAMYNAIYAFTISTFPGSIFVLSSIITGGCVVMLIILQYYRWKSNITAYSVLEN